MALWKDKRPAEQSAAPAPAEANEQTAVLREIRDELRALRTRVDSVVDRVDRSGVLGK